MAVRVSRTTTGFPFKAAIRSNIDLAPNDGLDSLRTGCLVEIDGSVQDPVISDRKGSKLKLVSSLDELVNAAGPIEHGILGMQM